MLKHPLTAETKVYFPGNARHGIWSSPHLVEVLPPTFKPGYPYMQDHGLPPLVADFEVNPCRLGSGCNHEVSGGISRGGCVFGQRHRRGRR